MPISKDGMFRPSVTDETKAKIVREYLDGQPTPRLAAIYGVSSGSISRWVKKAGHEMRPSGGKSSPARFAAKPSRARTSSAKKKPDAQCPACS